MALVSNRFSCIGLSMEADVSDFITGDFALIGFDTIIMGTLKPTIYSAYLLRPEMIITQVVTKPSTPVARDLRPIIQIATEEN